MLEMTLVLLVVTMLIVGINSNDIRRLRDDVELLIDILHDENEP